MRRGVCGVGPFTSSTSLATRGPPAARSTIRRMAGAMEKPPVSVAPREKLWSEKDRATGCTGAPEDGIPQRTLCMFQLCAECMP